MKITGLLIDVKTDPGMVRQVTLDEDVLETFYDVLQCHVIDIVKRSIGGIKYNIVCDDEELFDKNPIVSGVANNSETLVGNLFICNDDGEGHLTSLTDKDFEHVGKHLGIRISTTWKDGKEKFHVAPILRMDDV